ncbi:hypothetical protein F1880_004145 [Penicillium rolfsii]|nr:hypothetical protein F1880_004145 [Penicillium rolfsii]
MHITLRLVRIQSWTIVFYESLLEQLNYLVVSLTPAAIVEAYGYIQTRMLIADIVFMVLGFVWVGMMRNINVQNMRQTKVNFVSVLNSYLNNLSPLATN